MAIVSSQEVPRRAHTFSLRVGTPQSDPATPWPVQCCGVSERLFFVSHGASNTPWSSPVLYLSLQRVLYRNTVAACVQLWLLLVLGFALGCVRVPGLSPNPTHPGVFHREFSSPWFCTQNTSPHQASVFLTGRPFVCLLYYVLICDSLLKGPKKTFSLHLFLI